jgi:hypothetical protein
MLITTLNIGPMNGPYVGPGDIVGGATFWLGLRAYNAATTGTKAVNIRRSSDNATQDFNTLFNGNLDTVSIAAFIGGGNGFITELYDQTGNGNHFTQTTAANQPSYVASALGSLPAISVAASTSQFIFLTTAAGLSQPFTFSNVLNFTNGAAQNDMIDFHDAGSVNFILQTFNTTAANEVVLYAGNVTSTVTCSAGFWHALQSVFNGASSIINVDNLVSTPGTPGSGGVPAGAGNLWSLGARATGGTSPITADFTETGMWSSALSNTQQASLNYNQHGYWGF